MRFLTILGIFTVLAVAFVALPAATGVANPSKSNDNKKIKGTTTMSPKDLFLMHAQHSTKNLPGRKKSKATTATPKTTKATVPPTTATTPVTPPATAASAAPAAPAAGSVSNTSVPAVGTTTTTTAKPKGKGKSKGKGKGKGKAQTKPRSFAQSSVRSTGKTQEICKKLLGRQSRADCQKTKANGQGNNSKTAVSPMSTTAKMTTDSTQTTNSATTLAAAAAGAPTATATVPAANPAATTATSGTPVVTSAPAVPGETVATTTAASLTDKTSVKPEAVVNPDKLVSFNSDLSDMEMAGNAPQPMIVVSPEKAKLTTATEIKTKAELMARDIINGTHEEHNIFP